MLPANANFKFFARLPSLLHSHTHQSANPLLVDADKGVFGENAVHHIAR